MARQAVRGRTVDMTQGAIWPVLVSFSIPLLLGDLFQLMYNTVDSIVVGQFVGLEAFAAVSATNHICKTLVNFFTGLGVGASAVISQCFGARDTEKLHGSIQTTMALTFLGCVAMTALGLASCDWMLRATATPEDVFAEASLYLHIYFAGIGGLLIYNMGSAILRALGDTRRPTLFLVVSSVMNVILDLVFVLAFRWGIAGVAAATVASQAVSAVLVLVVLSRLPEPGCAFRWREMMRLDRSLAGRIMGVGLPVGLQKAVVAFSNVFVQAYINAFDTAAIAGWGCYRKLDQYLMLPMQSMGQAATTFVAQNLGAGRPDRAKKGVWAALWMSLGVAGAAAAVICAFPGPLVRLFIDHEEATAFGVLFIRLCTPFAALCSFNQVFSGAMRGAGKSRVPMVVTLCTHVFFRQAFLFVASRALPGNVYAVAIAYPMGWVICAVVISLCYRFSRWEENWPAKAG